MFPILVHAKSVQKTRNASFEPYGLISRYFMSF